MPLGFALDVFASFSGLACFVFVFVCVFGAGALSLGSSFGFVLLAVAGDASELVTVLVVSLGEAAAGEAFAAASGEVSEPDPELGLAVDDGAVIFPCRFHRPLGSRWISLFDPSRGIALSPRTVQLIDANMTSTRATM